MDTQAERLNDAKAAERAAARSGDIAALRAATRALARLVEEAEADRAAMAPAATQPAKKTSVNA